MEFDFEGELGRLRPRPAPAGIEAALEAAMEAALREGAPPESEAWSLPELEGLEPAKPPLKLEESLEVILSEDVPFEEWLRGVSPAPVTASQEAQIAGEFWKLRVGPQVAEAGGTGGPVMTGRFPVRRGVSVALVAAAVVVACAYLAGAWPGGRGGRGVAAGEDGFGAFALKDSAFGGGALSFRKSQSEGLASFSQGGRSGDGVSPGFAPAGGREGQAGAAGAGAPARAGGGERRMGGGVVETQGQGGAGDFAGTETQRLGRQPGEGTGLGLAWGPLALVRNSAQGVSQGANTGSSGDSTPKHSPILEALADGRVFEALPSALKVQIQGMGDAVAGSSTTSPPVVGGPLVAATPSVTGGEALPFVNRSAGVQTDLPVLNAVPLATLPKVPVSLGDAGTAQSEDVLIPAVVAGGTGGSGEIVMQLTGKGYEAADGVVVLTLRTVGAAIHAQVSALDGTLLSERPILNGDSLRTLGQQAKNELTVSPPVRGE